MHPGSLVPEFGALDFGSLWAWVWVGPGEGGVVSWASVSAELVPGSPGWPRLSLGYSCLWKAWEQASVSLRASLGTQCVTVPRLAASSTEGAWSKMDVKPFRPGVVEVFPQPFLPPYSLACCGPTALCRRHLKLVERPTL